MDKRKINYSNKFKEKMMKMPIENHNKAAWANIKDLKGEARVFNPNEEGIVNAKQYVDDNEK